MNDLISKYDVLEICKEQIWNGADDYYPISANKIAKKVKELPTVDAVPVTRCKDCKHCDWDIIDIPYGLTRHIVWCCFRFKENGENVEVSPNDFCSKAESKVSSNFE